METKNSVTIDKRQIEVDNILNGIASNISNDSKSKEVVEAYESLLQRSDLTTAEFLNFKIDYALSLSAQGNDGIEKAYAVLHEVLEATTTPFLQGKAIFALLSIYTTDTEAHNKMALVLDSNFFKNKNISNGDDNLKFRQIAEIGNALLPTSLGTIREAYWYAQQLLNNNNLSTELKVAYSQQIVDALAKSKVLAEQNNVLIKSYNKSVAEYTEGVHRAFLYTALARTDKKYIDQMQTEYKALFKIDSSENVPYKISQASLYAYFYYAGTLNAIDSVLYKEDIDMSINRILEQVQLQESKNDTDSRGVSFIHFIQNEATATTEDYNYIYLKNLAKYSEPFKNLLQKYGLNFTE